MTASVFTKRNLKGLQLHFPGSLQYERSVATANLEYRYETPLFVAKPTETPHVMAVVELANKLDIKLTMKGGGHSFGGLSNSLDGILLDMSGMKKVELELSNDVNNPGVVTLQAGALWGDAYKLLIGHQIDHYTIMGGRCPAVGVGGFTMGGGLCIFTRSYGMGIDHLKEATIVTVNKTGGVEVHTVTENDTDKKKKDLFWALRGCGGGNFGVLVEMKMKVRKLKDNEGMVTVGKPALRPTGNDEISVQKFIDSIKPLHTTNWPDALTMDSYWVCDTSSQTPLTITFPIYHNGNKISFDKAMAKLEDRNLATKLSKAVVEEKYTLFLQETLPDLYKDDMMRYCPLNKTYNLNSSFVYNNNGVTINNVFDLMKTLIKKFREDFPGSKSILELKMIHGGGVASTVGHDATAFPWRKGVYFGHIMVEWTDKSLGESMRTFFNHSSMKLREHSFEGKAAFINFTDRYLQDWEYAYYGTHFSKLQEVKKAWDPLDKFKFTQSISLPETSNQTTTTDAPLLNQGGSDQTIQDVNYRWGRYAQPEVTFDELVKTEGHSCANCSFN